MSFFDSKPMQIIERSLDAATLRQKVISNNIANVDTKNFKRSDVSFDDALKSYLLPSNFKIQGFQTDPRHFSIGTPSISQLNPQVVTEWSTGVTNNGNNVDIDSEMSQLAENQLRYNTLVQGMTIQFSELNSAINGGGK